MAEMKHNAPGSGAGTDDQTASEVPTDTGNFDGHLSAADDTVQKALDTLDDIAAGGSGDVSGPGSSTDNAVALWDGTGGDTLSDSAILESELETLTDGSNADVLHVHAYASNAEKYVIIGPVTAGLTDERVLAAGTAITVSDGGAGANVTVGVTASSIGTTQLTNDGVTNTKLANMSAATIKGQIYGGSGDPVDLTPAQARKVLIEGYTTLTYSASITPNATSASKFSLTISGNCAINVPTGLISGQTIEYRIRQNATGGYVVTWHADYETGEIPSTVVAAGANEYTYVLCKYNATTTKMHMVAFMRGYL